MHKYFILSLSMLLFYSCIETYRNDIEYIDYIIKNSSSYKATLNLYSQHKLRYSESMNPQDSIIRTLVRIWYGRGYADSLNWSVDTNYVSKIDSITIEFNNKERMIYGFFNYTLPTFYNIPISEDFITNYTYYFSSRAKYAGAGGYSYITVILSDSTYDHAMIIQDSVDVDR